VPLLGPSTTTRPSLPRRPDGTGCNFVLPVDRFAAPVAGIGVTDSSWGLFNATPATEFVDDVPEFAVRVVALADRLLNCGPAASLFARSSMPISGHGMAGTAASRWRTTGRIWWEQLNGSTSPATPSPLAIVTLALAVSTVDAASDLALLLDGLPQISREAFDLIVAFEVGGAIRTSVDTRVRAGPVVRLASATANSLGSLHLAADLVDGARCGPVLRKQIIAKRDS